MSDPYWMDYLPEDAKVDARADMKPQPPATGEDTVSKATEPWADFHGPLPDYDHPLRCVYESGIQYAVDLLAKVLSVTDYEICDGTEEFDGDLGGTMFNIVLAAMPTDADGDAMHPKDVRAVLANHSPDAGGVGDRVKYANNAAEVEAVQQMIEQGRCYVDSEGYLTPVSGEAARIVSWLRDKIGSGKLYHPGQIADAIESGTHLRPGLRAGEE